MKLNLQLILRDLNCRKPLLQEHDSSHGELRNVYLFTRGENCSEEYVYLLHASDLPSLKDQDASRRFHFIIQYEEGSVYEEQPENWDCLHITVSWKLEKTFRILQEIFEKYQLWEQQLTESVLTSQSLQEQLDLAAHYLPNPIAFFDTSFTLVGYAGRIPENFDDPIWNTVIHMQFASVNNLTQEYLHYYSASSHLRDLLVYPAFGMPAKNRIISGILRRGGRDFAIMAMDELSTSFEPCDLVLLRIVQDRLERSRRLMDATGSESARESKLFMDLMEGRKLSNSMTERLVELNHWREESWFTVICIEKLPDTNTLTDDNALSVMNRIQKAEPDLKMYYRQGRILGLMVSRKKEAVPAGLAVICSTLGLLTGISMSYQGWKHLTEARVQAETAVNYFENRPEDYKALADEKKNFIVYFKDIYPYHILQCIASDGHINYCIHPAIWRLYDRDRSEMLETLHVYLETGLQLSETARILGMHRNSVSYRLQCIEDLMGIQLDSVPREELQFIRLSCEILNFCGEF